MMRYFKIVDEYTNWAVYSISDSGEMTTIDTKEVRKNDPIPNTGGWLKEKENGFFKNEIKEIDKPEFDELREAFISKHK